MTRRVELVLVICAFFALGARTAYTSGLYRSPAKPTRTDAFTFLEGADAIVSGTNPFGLREREHGYPYVYPPTPAVVFVPLRPLGRIGAAIAWYVLSVLIFGCGVVALRRALGDDDWVPLALVSLPLASGLERGQLNPAIAGLVALAAAGLVRKRDSLGGAALAAAVALKATPVLGFAALVRRPRGALAAAGALFVLLLALPALFLGWKAIEANRDFAEKMGLRYVRDPGSPSLVEGARDYNVSEYAKNQSLVAVLTRTRLRETGAFKPVVYLLASLLMLGAAIPALRLPRDAPPRAVVAAVGLAASATLVAAPIAWHWHHAILFTPLAALGRSRAAWVFALLEGAYFLDLLAQPKEPMLGVLGLLGVGTLVVLVATARVALVQPFSPRP